MYDRDLKEQIWWENYQHAQRHNDKTEVLKSEVYSG